MTVTADRRCPDLVTAGPAGRVFTVEADDTGERRILAGVAVPFGELGHTSAGPTIFEPGSLPAPVAVPVVRGHDEDDVVGVTRSGEVTATEVTVRARISAVPAGDELLVLAADGAITGFSVGVHPVEWRYETDPAAGEVLVVSAAEWRHLGVVPFPAFTTARIATVAASTTTTTTSPTPEVTAMPAPTVEAAAGDPTTSPAPPVEPAVAPPTITPAVVVRAEAFPYTFDGTGPSILRDAVMRGEDIDAARRVQRAQAMLADPRLSAAAGHRFLTATTGTTVNNPAVVPPGYRPDLFTTLLAYEAPVWSSITRLPIADFTPFTIPHEATRAGLSGTPADETTPVAAGTITTGLDTVTPSHVMGKYAFSRDLAMSSNPAIDVIAMNALDEEWLKDVEGRAVAFFLTPANHTVAGATYADGAGFIKSARQQLAGFRVRRRAGATVVVAPGAKEYVAAVDADDTADRPLLGWGQSINAVGGQTDGAQEANILGVQLLPDGAAPLTAAKVLYLRREDAVAFATPLWNFRFEADATNPLVITLVKYSGVAFWTRRKEGVVVATNTTPIVFADEPAAAKAGK